ncbi:MAG: transcription antitermination factor NusB [Clostridiales bacterium]|nr:transcription antitermination factor NusB [Clostridiales bacterium]
MNSRIKTREAALVFIYQAEFRPEEYIDKLRIFRENPEYDELIDNDLDYFRDLTKGVIDNRESLDASFEPFLKNWRLERLPLIDRIILEIAVYEIKFMDSIQTPIAINEAVKLAKKYGTDKSSSFINGVLSSFEKSL